jgi:hypothetical protein
VEFVFSYPVSLEKSRQLVEAIRRKRRSNRRRNLPGYAAWEIHPVMKIDVQ